MHAYSVGNADSLQFSQHAQALRLLPYPQDQQTREWFNDNKARYESHVREPLLTFIEDFAGPLKKISAHFRADPRKVGGSLFRNHRDVRFSRDKSPYTTHAGIHFRHERSKDVYAPGLYLHLEPGGECFMATCIVGINPPTRRENAFGFGLP
ncbi:MAG: TIGR02453 family protein [Candidatus Latescibacterota bacterium]|nr:TIGR02453 family protein [Candidatus Latescibacterota bacterium]